MGILSPKIKIFFAAKKKITSEKKREINGYSITKN